MYLHLGVLFLLCVCVCICMGLDMVSLCSPDLGITYIRLASDSQRFKCWGIHHTWPTSLQTEKQIRVEHSSTEERGQCCLGSAQQHICPVFWEHLKQAVFRLQSWQRISLRWLLSFFSFKSCYVFVCVIVGRNSGIHEGSWDISEMHSERRNGLLVI